jgi:hypothetical protein
MSTQRWVVLTLTGNHWENMWSVDDMPWTFASYAQAEEEIYEHIRDCELAIQAGDMTDAPTRDAFRIAPHVDTFLTA